jgi:NADH-quinone oxidoreductase subunit L
MAIPQVILAVGAILLGWYGYSILHVVSGDFWQQGIFFKTKLDLESVPSLVKKAPLILGFMGIIAAYICYQFNPLWLKNFVKKIRFLYLLSFNKCYVDEVYECLIVRPLNKLAEFLWKIIDTICIDCMAIDGVAYCSRKLGSIVNKAQSGYIYHYLLVMLLAATIIISYFIIKL